MKRSAFFLMALMAVSTQAGAQLPPASGGEQGAFLKCFYECKPGPDVQGVSTYQEITTLMLTNQSPDERMLDLYYFDGKEQCVAHAALDLSTVDLDEVNVCHSLAASGVTPPQAGLVEILVTDPVGGTPADGVYAWGKNVLGKFRTDDPEPFQGRVTGIGKYECRVVPAEVQAEDAVANACTGPPPEAVSILVEDTVDRDCCNADLDNDGDVDVVDFQILASCIGQVPVGGCLESDINCDGVVDADDDAILQCQLGFAFPDPSCCQ